MIGKGLDERLVIGCAAAQPVEVNPMLRQIDMAAQQETSGWRIVHAIHIIFHSAMGEYAVL
jgi:hypothetical protein